jgi:hypothetical protein
MWQTKLERGLRKLGLIPDQEKEVGLRALFLDWPCAAFGRRDLYTQTNAGNPKEKSAKCTVTLTN